MTTILIVAALVILALAITLAVRVRNLHRDNPAEYVEPDFEPIGDVPYVLPRVAPPDDFPEYFSGKAEKEWRPADAVEKMDNGNFIVQTRSGSMLMKSKNRVRVAH